MSIEIIVHEGRNVAKTICDKCKKVIKTEPAEPCQHPGTTLLIYNWCAECGKDLVSPDGHLSVPFEIKQGPSFGNLAALPRVRIFEEETAPPRREPDFRLQYLGMTSLLVRIRKYVSDEGELECIDRALSAAAEAFKDRIVLEQSQRGTWFMQTKAEAEGNKT